jgi:hypothetical protein
LRIHSHKFTYRILAMTNRFPLPVPTHPFYPFTPHSVTWPFLPAPTHLPPIYNTPPSPYHIVTQRKHNTLFSPQHKNILTKPPACGKLFTDTRTITFTFTNQQPLGGHNMTKWQAKQSWIHNAWMQMIHARKSPSTHSKMVRYFLHHDNLKDMNS